jgi:excisionase family DNA binding protein
MMMNANPKPIATTTWLSLTEAAEQLDVHPTTLRRWADNGDIPVMRTPGGHRRFAAADVAQLAERQYGRSANPTANNLTQQLTEHALAHTRQELSTQEGAWMAIGNSNLRQRHRQLGRQLMTLTLQYIADPGENGELLEQARLAGQTYGQMAQESGLSLTEALKAALFFRDTLLEVALNLPANIRIQPETNLRLVQRINRLLNTVHLAIATCYDA